MRKYIVYVLIFCISILFNLDISFAKQYECIKPRDSKSENVCVYKKDEKIQVDVNYGAYKDGDETSTLQMNLTFDGVGHSSPKLNVNNTVNFDESTYSRTEDDVTLTYHYISSFDQLEYKKNVCPSQVSVCRGELAIINYPAAGATISYLVASPHIFALDYVIRSIADGKINSIDHNTLSAIHQSIWPGDYQVEYYVGPDTQTYYKNGIIPNRAYDYNFPDNKAPVTKLEDSDENPYSPNVNNASKYDESCPWYWPICHAFDFIWDVGNHIGSSIEAIPNDYTRARYAATCTTIDLTSGGDSFSASCAKLDISMQHLENCLRTYDGTMHKVDKNGNDKGSDLGCGKNAGGYNYKDKASCQADIGTEIYNYDYNIREECKNILSNQSYGVQGQGECIDRCANIGNEIAKLYEDNHYYGNNTVKCSLSSNIINFANNILNWFKYIAPVLVIILGILDFLKALVSQDNDAMKKAQGKFVRRLVAAVLLFIIPILIDYVLNVFNLLDSNCGATNLFK